MNLNLKGKLALVTAASKGIGKGVAKVLAEEGADVIISSRNEMNLREAAKYINRKTGREVLLFKADLRRKGDLEALANFVDSLGGADIFVFNTGGSRPAKFMETVEEDWYNSFKLLLLSAVRLTRLLVPGMIERGWGRIIYLTSIAIKQPIPDLILSNTVRLSLAGLTKSLATELAPHNITVNAIMPGTIDTEGIRELAKSRALREGKSFEEKLGEMFRNNPLGRAGIPEEIGYLVAFLASEKSSYITGAIIPIDGGKLLSIF